MKSLSLRAWISKPLRLADRARDAKNWATAARYYRLALRRSPSQPAIWVQYGHALKESGHLVEAEAAYRRSLELNGAVADSHLQLGHVLKLQGRTDEAACAYLRALLLVPWMPNAKAELIGLGWSERQVDEALLPNPVAVLGKSDADLYADALARTLHKKMTDIESRINAVDGELRTLARRFYAATAAIQDREAVLNRLRRVEELLMMPAPRQQQPGPPAGAALAAPEAGDGRDPAGAKLRAIPHANGFEGEPAGEARNSAL